jgi:hypothetical protein
VNQQLKDAACQRAGGRCEGRWHGGRCTSRGPFQLHYPTPGRETLADVRLLCGRCYELATALAWTCPRCGDEVFMDDEEALAFLEHAAEFYGPATAAEWLQLAGYYCSYCEQVMAKDD